MGSVDRADDRRFRVTDFTDDGESKLRESVTDKLKEFMGNYTDDNLVKYVIVLLKNGRSREEARKELDVFLGDDSDSFVTWLWDHLDSNLGLYVHPQGTYANEDGNIKPTLGEQGGRNDSRLVDSESEKGKPVRNRHRREWKGLLSEVAEQPPLRSSEIDNICSKERTHHKVGRGRRSPSPPPSPPQKKRCRHDERPHKKREAVPQAIDAPRRLLQFAVRDAVGTLKPSGSGREPSSKRLRSVVSTSTEDTIERPRRLQSIARVPNPIATVVKAVQEAAEDVMKVRPSGSVFDRLGRNMDASETDKQATGFRDAVVEDEEYDDFNQVHDQNRLPFLQKTDFGGQTGHMVMRECETRVASDLFSDGEECDDINVMDHRVMDVPQTGTSGGNKGEDLLTVEFGGSNNQRQHVSAANNSRKMANVSANVSTWKLPYHVQGREATAINTRKAVLEDEAGIEKSGMRKMKENSNPTAVGNGNAALVDVQTKSQKFPAPTPGSYTSGRPLEDSESRTIFVSNVHFGATLDSLSRHFNKFGDVLKVVIVTDPATGQPVGSAYVEFMRKEAADNALSLDGTSFMSRILKVVKKSASQQEANPVMTWPRVARGSPYTVPRFSRSTFARGIGGGFRSRPPMIQGARSLQWKRDAQATVAEGGAASSGKGVASPVARSLTYVRPEPKSDVNPGTS
ncbi:hypothetical protein Tsubulata_006195 [Turnera subulata]|uniref:RRM domain-containing protein n=1 Tax=Turnera subulata TaxID=218843 RepID=A0A9Q0FC37_9ROSI|nr:hypothetical protein Tsubulata_006195 [Turnera subulata]